jgi:farnesyl-diphosphate farnesyltransferase
MRPTPLAIVPVEQPEAPVAAGHFGQSAQQLQALGDDAFQAHLLDGVSRTFALTIPRLPPPLARPVSNAYLLCRIVDTIEDEAALASDLKRRFCLRFAKVAAGDGDVRRLSADLLPLLSGNTLPAEHELIAVMPRVIAITHSFDAATREALATCVATMAAGMADFQDRDLKCGLESLQEVNDYCYYVAGVVGEMLTKLFCLYSPAIAAQRDEMLDLAVSFGQGLQMTNILKDLWDDHQRGVCWLPRDIFRASGFDLCTLRPGHDNAAFRAGFSELVGIAHEHLKNALSYTMRIPSEETGIREFCLWALGMAVLTLRKINGRLDFDDSSQVKITRRAVKLTILASRIARGNNTMLRALFFVAGRHLPGADPVLARLRTRASGTPTQIQSS